MRPSTSCVRILVVHLFLILAACGGSGSSRPATAPIGVLASVVGGEGVPTPEGGWVAVVDDDGTVRYALRTDPDRTDAIEAVVLDVPGVGEFDLLASGDPTFDVAGGAIEGSGAIPASAAADVADAPEGSVLRVVYAGSADDGEGPVTTGAAPGWMAALGEDLPDGPIAAAGAFLDDDLTLHLLIALAPESLGDVQGVRLDSPATSGVGTVSRRVDQAELTSATDAAGATLRGSLVLTMREVAALLYRPEAHEIVLERGAEPDVSGTLRIPRGLPVWASLVQVAPAVGIDITAASLVRLVGRDDAEIVVAVGEDGDPALITSAELRAGPVGGAGAIAADALASSDWRISGDLDVGLATLHPGIETLTRLVGHPSGWHLRLVTPAGEHAGVFGRAPHDFIAFLTGEPLEPVIGPPANGTLAFTTVAPSRLPFVVQMGEPPLTSLDGVAVHDGPTDGDGALLIDFDAAPDFQATPTAWSGTASCDIVTFTRLIANPGQFHARATTPGEPLGVARGPVERGTAGGPPSFLFYPDVLGILGEPIEIVPFVLGVVDEFVIDPALPSGLTIDADTGTLSGTASFPLVPTTFTVTASNEDGDLSTSFSIGIAGLAPTLIDYVAPTVLLVGDLLEALAPTLEGGVADVFSITPDLPLGLVLDTATGVISGTPLLAALDTDYTITASNDHGSASTTLSFRVDDALLPPITPQFPSSVSLPTGLEITAITPASSVGAEVTWSISPPLPTGLSLNAETGAISGIPSLVSSATDYTITATNEAGSASTSMSLGTPLGAPLSLDYPTTTWIGSVLLGLIDTLTPTLTGGEVESFSVSPSLPLGLSLNPETGVLSGIPLGLLSNQTYTITATNDAGSTSTTIQISLLP